MIKSAVLMLVAIAMIACSSETADMGKKQVTVRGVTYVFPDSHIVTAAIPPASGRLFVRLSPPGAKFDLIIDELSHYSPNQQGDDMPTISRLNDVPFEEFSIKQFGFGPVLCGRKQPRFNCGFRFEDGRVRWSVLFDRNNLNVAAQIAADARAAIDVYRSNDGQRP